MTDPTPPPEPAAVRLIFEYEGDQVRLIHQQPVDVAVTGFDLALGPVAGHHVEVRGPQEELLSRVPVRNAMTASREVFPENPQDPIVRVDLPEARGAFTVIVPVVPQADHVALVRIAPGTAGELAERATSPAPGAPEVVELATFPLERGER
jgi:hypothetical protein